MEIYRADTDCPKCGFSGIQTRFCVKTHYTEDHRGLEASDPDHLDRECSRCGYKWFELPLDEES